MADEIVKKEEDKVEPKKAVAYVAPATSNAPQQPQSGGGSSTGGFEKKKIFQRRVQKTNRGERGEKQKREFESEIISIRRVTKVTGGGKRMTLSVFIVMGDKKGKIGMGIGKGADVRSAEAKAIDFAKKRMKVVNLNGNTIPHTMTLKWGAAKIFMKPAAPGTGVIAGGPVRKVLEVAGVKDVLTKQLGTSNQIMNAYATFEALKSMKQRRVK